MRAIYYFALHLHDIDHQCLLLGLCEVGYDIFLVHDENMNLFVLERDKFVHSEYHHVHLPTDHISDSDVLILLVWNYLKNKVKININSLV